MSCFRVASLTAIVVGTLLLRAAPAQDHVVVPGQAAQAPFSYALGKTKLSEAVDHWRASGAKILRAGHLALGSGSGADGLSKTSADKVVLVDVDGIDFEGIENARFGFYEQTLYLIQATLSPGPLNQKTELKYDKEQLASLEKSLRQKYGRPNEELRSMYVSKSDSPDVIIWDVDGNSLRFVSNAMNASLSLSNEQTEAKIREYRKQLCKTINTKGHITCW